MSNTNRQENDLTLGAFIRYVECAARGARQDYEARQNRIQHREHSLEDLPQPLDTTELLDAIPSKLADLTADNLLCKALRGLTTQEKRVLTLAILEEKPMEEIRQTLHISVKRVYELRYNALGKLRSTMKEGRNGTNKV